MTIKSGLLELSPTILWMLDDATGPAASDSGSHAHPGVYAGNFSLGKPGPEAGTSSVLFTNTGWVQAGQPGIVLNPPWSMAIWIAMGVNTVNNIQVIANVAANEGEQLLFQNGGVGATLIASIQQGRQFVNTTYQIVDGLWHQLVWVRTDGNNVGLYADGMSVWSSGAAGINGMVAGTGYFQLGPYNSTNTQLFAYAAALFDRALTTAEVSAQFNAHTTLETPTNIQTTTSADLSALETQITNLQTQVTALQTSQNTGLNEIATDTDSILGQTTLLPGIQTTTTATHTDTQNIVNTLFPQLQTPINYIEGTVTDILNGITSTVTTAAGAIATTIGKFFEQHSKDQLGTFNPTSGPTCAPIRWTAGAAAYWGLTVEITQYPAEWAFTTPADDWSIRDLAVLTIKIYGDQVVRYGIHTTTFSLSPLPETFPAEIADIGVPVTPPGYTIDVDWAGGVCGQLLLYYVPV